MGLVNQHRGGEETLRATAASLVLQDLWGWERFPSFSFLTGFMVSMDGPFAGCALATALMLPSEQERVFVEGWSTGTVAYLEGVVKNLGLGGLMLLTSFYTFVVQFGIIAVALHNKKSVREYRSFFAQCAGLGAVAAEAFPTSDDGRLKAFLIMMVKLMPENIPHLLWQGSLWMIQAHSGRPDPVIAVSVTLTAGMGVASSASFAAALCSRLRKGGDSGTFLHVMISLFLLTLGPGLCIGLAVRAVMALICPGHIWGFTTGCVMAA